MNVPKASGVPAAGTHGALTQTMNRLGSPVRSYSRPSATISSRAATEPGAIAPPVKSRCPVRSPAARAAAPHADVHRLEFKGVL